MHPISRWILSIYLSDYQKCLTTKNMIFNQLHDTQFQKVKLNQNTYPELYLLSVFVYLPK